MPHTCILHSCMRNVMCFKISCLSPNFRSTNLSLPSQNKTAACCFCCRCRQDVVKLKTNLFLFHQMKGWLGIILFIFYVFVKLFAIKLYKVGSGNQWLYPCSIVAASDKTKQTWVRTRQLYHILYLMSEMEPTLRTIERWLYPQSVL